MAAWCPAALMLLLVALLAQQPLASAASGRRALQEPAATEDADSKAALAVPPEFIITNDTLGSFLHRVASPEENAVIFTTTR